VIHKPHFFSAVFVADNPSKNIFWRDKNGAISRASVRWGEKKREVTMDGFIHRALSHQVLGACFSVHNILGVGLLEAQILNYLRLSGVPVGYLVNFRNQKVEWKRFVLGRE